MVNGSDFADIWSHAEYERQPTIVLDNRQDFAQLPKLGLLRPPYYRKVQNLVQAKPHRRLI